MVAGIAIAFTAAMAGCGSSSGTAPTTHGSFGPTSSQCSYGAIQTACVNSSALRGDPLQPAQHEPDQTFTDTAGNTYRIASANPGKTVLVYFGYTHCPDLCPAIMADTAIAVKHLPSADRAKLVTVFVSVDPNRDSLPVIAKWLDNFSTSFIGLRAPISTVVAAQHTADVPTSTITHPKHGKVHYSVQHSAELLVYTPDHLAHEAYTDGPNLQQDLEHDLPIIMNRQAWQ